MKYLNFSFSGKASRKEYWLTQAMALLVTMIILVVASTISDSFLGLMWLSSALASVLLYCAVGVRRCRDLGFSPFWVIAAFIPYIGLLVWAFLGLIDNWSENGN